MAPYAKFYGEWNDYHGSYRWQRLTAACAQQGIDTSDTTAHRALSDCVMTLRLIEKMKSAEVSL